MHISIDFKKFEALKSDMERLRQCVTDIYGCDMNYSDTGETIFNAAMNADASPDFTDFISSLCDVMTEWRNLVDN